MSAFNYWLHFSSLAASIQCISRQVTLAKCSSKFQSKIGTLQQSIQNLSSLRHDVFYNQEISTPLVLSCRDHWRYSEAHGPESSFFNKSWRSILNEDWNVKQNYKAENKAENVGTRAIYCQETPPLNLTHSTIQQLFVDFHFSADHYRCYIHNWFAVIHGFKMLTAY